MDVHSREEVKTRCRQRSAFEVTRPLSQWSAVPAQDWTSWKWQQRSRIRSRDQFKQMIGLTTEESQIFDRSQQLFLAAVTPYYASLIDPNNPKCPIRLQSIPQSEELEWLEEELADPLGEESHMPVPGLTHRYPDRVLLYCTHHCAVYCRHCLRKRKVSDPSSASTPKDLDRAIQYIGKHPEVRDVLVSGGDPLSMSDDRLIDLMSGLRAISHVEIIRLATRNLVTLPFRVTEELVERLRPLGPIYVHTHFNHPKECTQEALQACTRLAMAGMVLNNQMVLLKGINDEVEIVKELSHRLLQMRVQPYYMFNCDLAKGISHFRVPIHRALEIIRGLQGWTSGMAVPQFVVDLPGGGGKVRLTPDSVIEQEGNIWRFRDYRGQAWTYREIVK